MPNSRYRRPASSIAAQPQWKNVLVLGGSYGGSRAARVLAEGLPEGYRVLLVDRQSHFNHLYVFPRYTVVQGHEHKAFIPYADLNPPRQPSSPKPPSSRRGQPVASASYPDGDDFYYSEVYFPSHAVEKPAGGPHQVLQATVKSIHPEYVRLSRTFPEYGLEAQVPYEYLVYALGSVMPKPLVMPPDALYKLAGVGWMIDQQKRMRKAKNVVIVGGGALGIQYASDIAEFHPKKHVTLIHSRARLLPRFDPRLHPLIIAQLEKLGVDVVLNDRLLNPTIHAGKLHTLRGNVIECDYLMLCTGQTPNTTIISDSFAKSSINPLTGQVTVLRTLQFAPFDLPALSECSSTASTSQPTSHSGSPSSSSSRPESTLGLSSGSSSLIPAPPCTSTAPSPPTTAFPTLFAIGDAADAFGALKAGHTAYYQAELAARNIILLARKAVGTSAPGTPLAEYVPGPPAIKLTVGLTKALVQTGKRIEESTCTEDLDAEVMWASLGADPTNMWA